MSFESLIKIDPAKIIDHLTDFIRSQSSQMGFGRLVVGVSGGVDSALVAYLSVKALEKQNVYGVIMPYKSSNPENMKDAELVISSLGIKSTTVDITPMVDAYFEKYPDADKVRRGNKMARERMSVLYDISAREKALVIGTSNRSEILLGYGTIFGDLACALNPIGDLYKTQIRLIAKKLGVPEKIIAKPPSADLYTGQSDEGEFGFTYESVDKLLYLLTEEKLSPKDCQKAGFSADMITRVISMINSNKFKGQPPVIARISALKAGSSSGNTVSESR